MTTHTQQIQLPTGQKFSLDITWQKDVYEPLSQISTLRTAVKREKIFEAGQLAEFIYVVLSGAFKLQKDVQIMDFVGKQESIGALLTQPGARYPITCVCMNPGTLLEIPTSGFLKAKEQNPILRTYFEEQAFRRIQRFQDNMKFQATPVAARLANLLLGRSYFFAHHKVTRGEIAACLGTTTESVIRTLGDWQDQGLVASEGKILKILNPERLKEVQNER